MVDAPWPIAVRRSVASTSSTRAGIRGAPGRSTRENTIPVSGGAGRAVTVVVEPVCSPTPCTDAVPASVRLGMSVSFPDHGFQLPRDGSQAIEDGVGAEPFPVGPGRRPAVVGAGRNVAAHSRLRGDPGPVSYGEM